MPLPPPIRQLARPLALRWGPSAWMQPAIRAVAAEVGLQQGGFLDLAADEGWLCIHVAAGHPELDAVGLVRDRAAQRQADQNKERRLNCTFKVLPPHALTVPSGTFDVAAALSAVGRWTDAGAVLEEVHRVLTPGGRLLVYEPDPTAEIPPEWVSRRGGWPLDAVVRRHLARHAVDEGDWSALKETIRRSSFGGGEEGRHGFFRRLVLRR